LILEFEKSKSLLFALNCSKRYPAKKNRPGVENKSEERYLYFTISMIFPPHSNSAQQKTVGSKH
jgi:hypothetical protein